MLSPVGDSELRSIIAVLVAFVLGSCAGGNTYRVDTGDLAQRYLPTTREVDHHPDSLRGFTISEGDDQFEIEIEGGYEALHRKWSSTYQNMGTGRSQRARSYATLWSKELSLAALEADVGFSSLTKERAQDLLNERRNEYENAIEVDVYWFESEGNSLLAGPGSTVHLEVGGERYRPASESHGPLRETFLMGGDGRALYRRNTFRFARTVDSTDILHEAKGMTLTISGAGVRQQRVRFAWEWGDEAQS